MTAPHEKTLTVPSDDSAERGPSSAVALSFAVVFFGVFGVIALVVALLVGTGDKRSTNWLGT